VQGCCNAAARTFAVEVATSQRTMPRKPTTVQAISPREMGARKMTHPAAMSSGVLVTNSSAWGRLVRARPHTHVQKCSAKQTPEAAMRPHDFHHSFRTDGEAERHCQINIGTITIDVICRRQAAAVIAGTSDSRIVKTTAADDTARICNAHS
jgi:hypothetical protein